MSELSWNDAPHSPGLAVDEVHLWRVWLSSVVEDGARSVLDDAEAERARRFLRPLDGARFASGRTAMRRILASYLAMAPGEIQIAPGRHGKPRLVADRAVRVEFNFTHADELALLAVARRPVGIDTERIYAFTFSLNAAICGAAGALISMIWVIQPFFGIAHSIRSFVIVTAAGLGNLPGVIMAGLGLGVAELYSGFVFGAELQQFTVVGLLVAVLVLRQIQQRKHRQAVQ